MTRLQIIVLAVALTVGAFHLGYKSGRDHAYTQFEQLDQEYPCSTDMECQNMFGEEGIKWDNATKSNMP